MICRFQEHKTAKELVVSDHSNATSSYSLKPVPESELVNGFKVAQVIFGIGITLPVFWLGAQTTEALGFNKALRNCP